MPNSIDLLRAKRESGYSSNTPDFSRDVPEEGRTLQLAPEEMQGINPSAGGPVTVTVTGTLGPDGLMTVEAIKPGPAAAPEAVQAVRPTTEISPS